MSLFMKKNLGEIRQALEQPRASLSPSRFSKDDFKKFKRTDAHATKESRVATSVMPIIEGDPGDTRCIASDVPFSNLDHLTDGSLVYAKPDLYYGSRPEQLHPKYIKGPDGSLSVAIRQALYDGTCGALNVRIPKPRQATSSHNPNSCATLSHRPCATTIEPPTCSVSLSYNPLLLTPLLEFLQTSIQLILPSVLLNPL
ncbi:hypothetical protein F5883DRAFT_659249 [Diaporthe sp. PMI_573]|nr:hypothetical protein F5883DRAFT_659249 [Diaporthaceae sp. PMI_573]